MPALLAGAAMTTCMVCGATEGLVERTARPLDADSPLAAVLIIQCLDAERCYFRFMLARGNPMIDCKYPRFKALNFPYPQPFVHEYAN